MPVLGPLPLPCLADGMEEAVSLPWVGESRGHGVLRPHGHRVVQVIGVDWLGLSLGGGSLVLCLCGYRAERLPSPPGAFASSTHAGIVGRGVMGGRGPPVAAEPDPLWDVRGDQFEVRALMPQAYPASCRRGSHSSVDADGLWAHDQDGDVHIGC